MSAPAGRDRDGGPEVRAVTPERYVTARELAGLMGVSERTIKRIVAAGMPSETWGMARTRRFLPSMAMCWARESASTTLASDLAARGPATPTSFTDIKE